MSELLISFIPPEMLKDSPLLAKLSSKMNRLDFVLNEMSSIIQDSMITTTIEMDNDYIIYRNDALLRTGRSIL